VLKKIINIIMGKENKKSESSKDDGLQTLKTTVKVNTIDSTVNSATVKQAFDDKEGVQKSQVKSTKTTPPPIAPAPMQPPPSVIEEKDLVQETNYTRTIIHKNEEPVVELVYEITFIETQSQGKVDRTVYTKDVPIFKTKNVLFVSNLFGRENLKEIVLRKREIKASCKKPLAETEFELDLRNGVLVKVIPEQPWMNSDYESTKKTFDEMVLKAYRELSSLVKPEQGNDKNKRSDVGFTNGRPQIIDLD